jgi:hypothetical protein
MFHPFPHTEIAERFTSYTPQAKERHGKGRQLRVPTGGDIGIVSECLFFEEWELTMQRL